MPCPQDENGNAIPPSPEELEKREWERGKLLLELHIKDTKDQLGYFLTELDHMDAL